MDEPRVEMHPEAAEGPSEDLRASMIRPLRVEIHSDAHAAARAGAEAFVAEARAAVEARGRFSVALSGGTAPREMYALRADDARIPWEGVHLFWGDERCVPPLHPRSNYAMAWNAFGETGLAAPPPRSRFRGRSCRRAAVGGVDAGHGAV
jgi:hypothetical protein